MNRWLRPAIAFPVAFFSAAAIWSYFDYHDRLDERQDALLAHSRLIAAHADAALGDAEKIMLAVEDEVAAWDQREPRVGDAIHARLKKMLQGSAHLSSAWVLDAEAINLVDSWSYPARPVSGVNRVYFMRHREGARGPLVMADPVPGAITGRHRFTYSVAQRHPDGRLKSIIVVGIYSDHFAQLYTETTKWTGAKAGFYDGTGSVLAQHNGDSQHQTNTTPLLADVVGSSSRAAVVEQEGERRLMAQTRSREYPTLYASVSQPMSAIWAEWAPRGVVAFAIALAASFAFIGFVRINDRVQRLRNEAEAKDLAVREAHHRIKNGLQLMATMIHMRERLQNTPAAKELMRDVAQQVRAVAEVHDLLQNATRMDSIDLNVLLDALCRSLRANWHGTLECQLGDNLRLDSATGSVLAIVANELLTNALKHAASSVTLRSEIRMQALVLTVSNDGPPLPSDFKLYNVTRFGLKTAVTLCSQIGATLHPLPGEDGAAFRVTLPLEKQALALAS